MVNLEYLTESLTDRQRISRMSRDPIGSNKLISLPHNKGFPLKTWGSGGSHAYGSLSYDFERDQFLAEQTHCTKKKLSSRKMT